MHLDSLISMNITYMDSVLNKKYPILFYWDGKNEPITDICNDKKIQDLLKSVIENENLYDFAQINYVTYKFDGETDHYEENTINVKDYFNYDKVSDTVKQDIIISILNDVHFKVFNSYYPDDILDDDFKKHVNNILKEIRSHYTKEISNETIINYVRKTYKEQSNNYSTKIKEENEDIIVRTLEEVI